LSEVSRKRSHEGCRGGDISDVTQGGRRWDREDLLNVVNVDRWSSGTYDRGSAIGQEKNTVEEGTTGNNTHVSMGRLTALRISDGRTCELARVDNLPLHPLDGWCEAPGRKRGAIRNADGIWNVYFGPLTLGRFHEQHMRIKDEHGRLIRHRV